MRVKFHFACAWISLLHTWLRPEPREVFPEFEDCGPRYPIQHSVRSRVCSCPDCALGHCRPATLRLQIQSRDVFYVLYGIPRSLPPVVVGHCSGLSSECTDSPQSWPTPSGSRACETR